MITVSAAWKAAMNQGTGFWPTATITLANNEVLTLGKADFMVSNNSITDAAGANGLPIGVAICRTIQLEINNADGRFDNVDFQDAKCRLNINMDLLTGVSDYFAAGEFYLENPDVYGKNSIILTGYDIMHKADKPYKTDLTYPARAIDILRDACTKCGIPFTASTIPNGTLQVTVPIPDTETFRSVIGHVAGLSGGNARIDRTGNLKIVSYNWSTLETCRSRGNANGINDFSRYTNLTHEVQDVQFTGIKTTYYDQSTGETQEIMVGTDGYVMTINNPLIVGQELTVLAYIFTGLAGARFNIFNMDHVAYPIAEFGDCCRVIDQKGNYIYSVITDINFNFNGYTTISNSADKPTKVHATYQAPGTGAIQRAAEMVQREKTSREQAVADLADRLAAAGGMYETTQAAAGGGTIYYLHDKPTLANSVIVLKLTGEALGISTDGGQTYPTGWDFVTGTTITNTLQAVGINADWITTGTISDANNNVVINLSTGALTMKKGSINIGNGQFVVSTAGAVTAKALTVTGGTISLTGSNSEDNRISIRYNNYWLYASPKYLQLKDETNSSNKIASGLSAGLLRFTVNNVTRARYETSGVTIYASDGSTVLASMNRATSGNNESGLLRVRASSGAQTNLNGDSISLSDSTSHTAVYMSASGISLRNDADTSDRLVLYRSSGNIWSAGTMTATSFINSSSRKVKKDIKDMGDALATIKALRPVTFRYKTEEDDAPVHYGLIAEEAYEVAPDMVYMPPEDIENLVPGIDYSKLTPYLLKGMQTIIGALEKAKILPV